MRVCVCVCVCVCACACECVYVCVRVCVSVSVTLFVALSVILSVSVSLSVCVCLCLCLCVLRVPVALHKGAQEAVGPSLLRAARREGSPKGPSPRQLTRLPLHHWRSLGTVRVHALARRGPDVGVLLVVLCVMPTGPVDGVRVKRVGLVDGARRQVLAASASKPSEFTLNARRGPEEPQVPVVGILLVVLRV